MDENNYIPIEGATIQVFTKESNMLTDSPVLTLSAVSGEPGNYHTTGGALDEGDYFLLASASGRGSVIHYFTLPSPANPDDLVKYIGPINMVAGLSVMGIEVIDKDDTPITSGIDLTVAKLLGAHNALGVYNINNVPVGVQPIELKPDDDEVYQHRIIQQTITNPMDEITIKLYPPITLNVTVRVGTPSSSYIDTTCTLFEVVGDTKIRQINRNGNIFPIKKLADGEILLRPYDSTGQTPLALAQAYILRYTDTGGTGVLNRSFYHNQDSVLQPKS